MILGARPGRGRPPIMRLMAKAFDAEPGRARRCSRCSDIREAVQAAEHTLASSGRRTILFVDEVHRFNKAQQDAFLPYVEQAAPSPSPARRPRTLLFEVNSALLSRAAVYVLEPLSPLSDLEVLLERTDLKIGRRTC